MVLLVGNYPLDGQESMQRFSQMMLEGLHAAGVPAELITPRAFFGKLISTGGSLAKWLGYIDKYLLFPRQLRRRVARGVSLVHICDHSNAVYAPQAHPQPVVISCHDLLAVRGALGEATHCPASATGRILQRWILRSLGQAAVVACDSEATRLDAVRLIRNGSPQICLVSLGLNFPYRKLDGETLRHRLELIAALPPRVPYVLHVGSNLPRKNRDGVLRIFARTKTDWAGRLIFAGEPLSSPLRALADELGIADRVVEVPHPSNETLEALYNGATALVYPSFSEGFGWPIAEAQACGCPVICSALAPLPEVGGAAAFLHPVADEAGFAADILRLANTETRAAASARSLQNAERFAPERMIAQYVALYRQTNALPASS